MMMTIATCITTLERQRGLIDAALTSLKALEADQTPVLAAVREARTVTATGTTPRVKAASALTSTQPAKPARAAREAVPSATTVPGATPALRRHQDAVLQVLLRAVEPMQSADIARRTSRSQTAVNGALAQLEKSGHVVRTGKGRATRWSLAKAKTSTQVPQTLHEHISAAAAAKPVQPATTSTPRTGTTRVDGVEFETVFDGSRGQSLTGDRDTKGRLGVGNV